MTGIIVFLLVLSLLIFIHELGHFLAAKWCDIYVDRFSIGMPPRVLGFRVGETDYCISALPFGGYVKMAGQEDAPLSDEERERDYGHVPPHRFFNAKPVWQRIVVLIAGPLMNLLLAFVIYLYIAAAGAQVPLSEVEARVGLVRDDAPAADAPLWAIASDDSKADTSAEPDTRGWKTNDLVVSMDGASLKNVNELAMNLILGGEGTAHRFVLERTSPDGSVQRYYSEVAPKLLDPEEHDYPLIGVAPYSGAQVGDVMAGYAAADSGLQQGDIIRAVNGAWVDRATFVQQVEKTPEGEALDLTVERGDEALTVQLTPRTVGRLTEALLTPGYSPANGENADAQPVIEWVGKEFGEAYGVQRFDRLAEINGQPATAKLLYETEKNNPGAAMKVKIERPAVLFGLVAKAETIETEIPIESVRAIGVSLTTPTVFDRAEPAEILPRAWQECQQQVGVVTGTLRALFSGKLSPKELGGPLTIGMVTAEAAEQGWERLFRTTAFISLNLFILNLLPLPVLDGGQIVLNSIEAIRRKPLSIEFQERLQQVGVVLLLGLMLYVTWNDVGRIVSSYLP
ncbi:MAG: PDZ domain-containing protein [Candidatus Hydrogenedens sp.]|nr:PDZ domain-containing protein [Candidatus Hydrogenedens sp.]